MTTVLKRTCPKRTCGAVTTIDGNRINITRTIGTSLCVECQEFIASRGVGA